jgi:hypothetical protein
MIDPHGKVITVDAAELTGYHDLLGRTVGRLLYGQLQKVLDHLSSPSVLVVDFARLDQVDTSILLISIVKATALALSNIAEEHVLVCGATTATHRAELSKAVAVWPEIQDPWRERPRSRLLLLASDREPLATWHLLGREDLTPEEERVWASLMDEGCSEVRTLALRVGMDEERTHSCLKVFVENCVVTLKQRDGQVIVCPLFRSVLASTSESELW